MVREATTGRSRRDVDAGAGERLAGLPEGEAGGDEGGAEVVGPVGGDAEEEAAGGLGVEEEGGEGGVDVGGDADAAAGGGVEVAVAVEAAGDLAGGGVGE